MIPQPPPGTKPWRRPSPKGALWGAPTSPNARRLPGRSDLSKGRLLPAPPWQGALQPRLVQPDSGRRGGPGLETKQARRRHGAGASQNLEAERAHEASPPGRRGAGSQGTWAGQGWVAQGPERGKAAPGPLRGLCSGALGGPGFCCGARRASERWEGPQSSFCSRRAAECRAFMPKGEPRNSAGLQPKERAARLEAKPVARQRPRTPPGAISPPLQSSLPLQETTELTLS